MFFWQIWKKNEKLQEKDRNNYKKFGEFEPKIVKNFRKGARKNVNFFENGFLQLSREP